MISKKTLDQIDASVRMEDVIEYLGLEVRGIGRSKFISCPFHSEKTPSMQIRDKSVKCYGCGKVADAVELVRHVQNVGFPEAIKMLSALYGIKPETESDNDEPLDVITLPIDALKFIGIEDRITARAFHHENPETFWNFIKRKVAAAKRLLDKLQTDNPEIRGEIKRKRSGLNALMRAMRDAQDHGFRDYLLRIK